MNHDFSNKTIIVTGAASGMGRATTLKLIELGATVYAADRNYSGLKETCEQSGALLCVIDISKVDECNALIEKAQNEQGKLDGLVNFAGVIKRNGLLECTDEEFDFVMDINVKACFYLCRAAARQMIKQGAGSIVNVSSLWSEIAAAGVFGYCVSKGAVSQITRSAALDLAGTGVRVNEVRPGETNTAMLASERGYTMSQEEIDAKLKNIADSIPEKRLADPCEIAAAAIFLLSDQSSYMQGASITVDGGYSIC
jgi:NAD(P)-dependent dehydrogenase (short-subunit alcohol dehydrogenase family)